MANARFNYEQKNGLPKFISSFIHRIYQEFEIHVRFHQHKVNVQTKLNGHNTVHCFLCSFSGNNGARKIVAKNKRGTV